MKFMPKGALLRNTGWIFIGQGAAYFARIVYFVIIARLLGVLQYGIVVGALALVTIFSQYTRLGTGMVMLRYVSADHSKFAVYWGNVLLVTVSTGSIVLVLLHFAAPHLIGPASASIIVVMAIGTCICEQLTTSATQVFQALEDMRLTATLNLMTPLARTGVAAAMLIVMHHASAAQWAVASTLAAVAVLLVAFATVTVKIGLPGFDFLLLRTRSAEGLEYAFAASTSTAYDDVDKAMLSHYGMSVAAGIYAMAYRIIDMATMPISSLQLAAEPRLFKLGINDLQDTMKLGRELIVKGMLVSLGLSVVLLVSAPIIPLLVGHSFEQGVSALRWLCLIPLFRSVHYMAGSILTCAGHQRYRTVCQLIAAAGNFGVNLWLIPRFGWHGAAWSSLATDFSLGLMNWGALMFLVRRRIPAPVTAFS